jgi:hypothetical protein
VTHWARKCRCAGVSTASLSTFYLGVWCGREASQEDGLCDDCRSFCPGNAILTMEQARERDTLPIHSD